MTGRERQQQIEEALTPNERAIIASIIDHSDESETVKKWLRLVIRQHDALAARLSGLQDTLAAKEEALRAIAAEDDGEEYDLPTFADMRLVGFDSFRLPAIARAALAASPASELSHEPTQRDNATTTPEGAKGWVDQAGSAQVLAGGHGLTVAPDASPGGSERSPADEQDGGGKPSTAPNAASPTSEEPT